MIDKIRRPESPGAGSRQEQLRRGHARPPYARVESHGRLPALRLARAAADAPRSARSAPLAPYRPLATALSARAPRYLRCRTLTNGSGASRSGSSDAGGVLRPLLPLSAARSAMRCAGLSPSQNSSSSSARFRRWAPPALTTEPPPTLLALDAYELSAVISWGQARLPATFTLTHKDPPRSLRREKGQWVSDEERQLKKQWKKLKTTKMRQ